MFESQVVKSIAKAEDYVALYFLFSGTAAIGTTSSWGSSSCSYCDFQLFLKNYSITFLKILGVAFK